MSRLKEKIAQIKEYNRLKQERRIKGGIAMDAFLRWGRALRAIEKEYPLDQHLVIEDSPDKFGLWGKYPCRVSKTGNEKYRCGFLTHIDAMSFTCPNFSKDKVCEKCECMYNMANQEYVNASKDFDIISGEFNKIDLTLRSLRKSIFGRGK